MSKIFIEKREIKIKVKESVEDTSFEIKDGKYVESAKLNRKYTSDIYAYVDFNVLFAMENMFDEYYVKIILFNDDKKLGYNLVSLSSNLDISVKRVSAKNFLILGINKDQNRQGQASFCSLQKDGSVNEITIKFNYINQYKVIEQKYFLLNYIEILETPNEDGSTKKTFANTIAVYREDGTILKILVNEKLNVRRDLVCDVDSNSILIYYKDDGSIVKKLSLAEILLTSNDEFENDDKSERSTVAQDNENSGDSDGSNE